MSRSDPARRGFRVTGIDETAAATLTVSQDGQTLRLAAHGDWVVRGLGAVDAQLRGLNLPRGVRAEFDLSDIDKADTTGAWLIERTRMAIKDAGSVTLKGAPTALGQLLDQVAHAYAEAETVPPKRLSLLSSLEGLGRGLVGSVNEGLHILSFTGRTIHAMLRWTYMPQRIRITPIIYHMEQVGLNAVPIISLISFLIGAVLAFLGSDMLREFGAQVYTVALVSFAFLREFGVLLTAIMLAGRSGSAFTAQIGSMKGREEIDAMSALGLDYVELLVVPRVIAMIICLPMLTFLADIMGLIGGGVVLFAFEGISPAQYFIRLENVTEIQHFNVGMIKSVFFAAAIAIIGCYQGLKVEGSAESVGQRTTLSVVEAIFTVIVLDALFAIYFIEIDY